MVGLVEVDDDHDAFPGVVDLLHITARIDLRHETEAESPHLLLQLIHSLLPVLPIVLVVFKARIRAVVLLFF